MKQLHLVQDQFPIGHQGTDGPFVHAHVLRVCVESLLETHSAVRTVLDEFRDRIVNDMLPGGKIQAEPENVAAYLHERLTGWSVQAVEVWYDDRGVRLEW